MSEKQQRTAASTREKMMNRYSDGLKHKHNKYHNSYRKHFKTHPVQTDKSADTRALEQSTGQNRILNLRKVRKRLDKGSFH